MQTYAKTFSTVCATEICKNMQKYANCMHPICKNMQNMQSRFAYAKYAKICTPHFDPGRGDVVFFPLMQRGREEE